MLFRSYEKSLKGLPDKSRIAIVVIRNRRQTTLVLDFTEDTEDEEED